MKILHSNVMPNNNIIEITMNTPESATGTAVITFKSKNNKILNYQVFDVFFDRGNYNYKEDVLKFLDEKLNKNYLNKILANGTKKAV